MLGIAFGGRRESLAAIAVGRAGDPDCLSLWLDVRGETRPFCGSNGRLDEQIRNRE